MNQRQRRKIISRHFYGRFHGVFIWKSAEAIAWDSMRPVGREFGSPDYDRLMQEDFDNKTGVFSLGLAELWEKKVAKNAHMELPSH